VASAKFQSADKAIAIINDYLSTDWIKKSKINIESNILKNPVQSNEFVALTDKVANVPFNSVYGFVQQQTTFIPIILFFVIIVAAQMVAMAVANEKENKTLEILLSSPISRKTIVFSKLVGAGLVALLFAAVYMVGFYNYLGSLSPKADITGDIGLAIASLGISLGIGSYLLLGISLFLGILVALAIAMILGVLIDSIKNIQAVITPLMILVLLPYLLVMFLDFNSLSSVFKWIIYVIPFSHPFLAIQQMMVHNYLAVILGIVYQLIVFIIFVAIAAKIFSSDKILTLKLNFGKRKRRIE
jgi:ABC-2 type transport system permease protein